MINDQQAAREMAQNLTVIIPAYNEEETLADTISSLKNQSVQVKEIIVVDDCSTDKTELIATKAGVRVVTPLSNTGSKAGAQNFALAKIGSEFVMAIDADTTLDRFAIENLILAFLEENVVAACGYVLPRFKKTIWERGRYIEYLFAFNFFKQVQDYYNFPLISSGCFSIYRTAVLKRRGGWPVRTMAEDMDLTWSFYEAGYKVRFVPDAVCYPIEPSNFSFMHKQLKRWSHGFVQNFLLHSTKLAQIPFLRALVLVAFLDGLLAALFILFVLPLLIIFSSPYFALFYIIDLPTILIPVIAQAKVKKEIWLTISSIPSYYVLRTVNAFMFLEAIISEIIFRKRLVSYEKGH